MRRLWPPLCGVLLLLGCSERRIKIPYNETRILLGTFVNITIYDQDKDRAKIARAGEEAFQAIERIDKITSSFYDSSEVSLLRHGAGRDYQRVSKELLEVLREAIRISNITHSAFDVTIGPIMELWDFNSPSPQIPNTEQIKKRLPLVNYKNILIKGDKVLLANSGMSLDLGGIAKGYAVDKAMEVLIKNGIENAMVDAGGDLRTISGELTKGKRRVWIRHPRDKNSFFGYFRMDSGCVATAGDYERFFLYKGKRYHHLIDPKSGYPAQGCLSVTIKAETTAEADALATAVFILGPERGMDLIERLEGVEGVIIYRKGDKLDYKVSTGLADNFHLP